MDAPAASPSRRYTTGPIRLAYHPLGNGADTLIVIPGWISHLDLDWNRPEIRAFYQQLARGRRVVRYDRTGTGLSDRPDTSDLFDLNRQLADLLAVVDACGAKRVHLLSWFLGGPLAIAFAAAHPDRVSKIVLVETFARFRPAEGYSLGRRTGPAEALYALVKASWYLGSHAMAAAFVPHAESERVTWLAVQQRNAASAAGAVALMETLFACDVRDLLPAVSAPALVLHRRHDTSVPIEFGIYLADHLPAAAFCELAGTQPLPFFDDTSVLLDQVSRFLGTTPIAPAPLSARELEVLRLVADGLQNRDIARRLDVAPATINRHLVNIYDKLGVSTRAAAVAYAFRNGVV